MNTPWPVTIIEDRYGGVYSGAEWLAFNKLPEQVGASDALGEDFECSQYFDATDDVIGKGKTPQEAYDDLCRKLNPNSHD